jgi:uncharacterized protein YcbX
MYLQDIYVYPIKSLKGIRLTHSILEERGLQYDRRWMLVDNEGSFLSQRKFPSMAMFEVEISDPGLKVFHKSNPGDYIVVPFSSKSGTSIQVKIWEDHVNALNVDHLFDAWFSKFLGISCHLVYMPDTTRRKIKAKYAENEESVSFADGMPYLIIGQESLNDLNQRLKDPVPMDRFRPNLVFSGGEPFLEDKCETLKIGKALFKVTKPCARCVMTTVDQKSGKRGKEPLKTLATYRTIGQNVMFGQNMLLLEGKEVMVGDRITPNLK